MSSDWREKINQMDVNVYDQTIALENDFPMCWTQKGRN